MDRNDIQQELLSILRALPLNQQEALLNLARAAQAAEDAACHTQGDD